MTASGRIVFLGDSITEMGDKPYGYLSLIRKSLRTKYGDEYPELVNAGISGNKVTDLLERLDRDVISRTPATVVIYVGVNDVWHFSKPGLTGTPKGEYESGLAEIIARIKETGARAILCTPTVIGEKTGLSNPLDALLDEYAELSRKAAAKGGIELCDLHAIFREYLRIHNNADLSRGVLTLDGVHLSGEGNRLVADELVRFLDK